MDVVPPNSTLSSDSAEDCVLSVAKSVGSRESRTDCGTSDETLERGAPGAVSKANALDPGVLETVPMGYVSFGNLIGTVG